VYDGEGVERIVARATSLTYLACHERSIEALIAAGPFPSLRELELPRLTASAALIERIVVAAPNLGRLNIQPEDDDDARDLLGQLFPVYTVVKPRELPSSWARYYPR
jgi:hypothetical protein